jgi:hypothetical protein
MVERIHLGQECPKMSGFVRLEKDSKRQNGKSPA